MSTTFGFKVTAGFPFMTLRRHQPTRLNRSENIVLVICLVALAILSLPDDYYATLWASPEFKVESATVTGLNATGSELTAAWDITLLATNPFRKHKLSFHHLHAWVVRGDYSRIGIGATTLPPFDVNKRNQVNLKLAAASQWVGCDVGKEIYDGQRRGLVSFGVHVCARLL